MLNRRSLNVRYKKLSVHEEMHCPARIEIKSLKKQINIQQAIIEDLTKRIVELEKRPITTIATGEPPKSFDYYARALVEFRAKYSITQATLGKMLGVAQTLVSAWENKVKVPRRKRQIMALLKLESDEVEKLIAEIESEEQRILNIKKDSKPKRRRVKHKCYLNIQRRQNKEKSTSKSEVIVLPSEKNNPPSSSIPNTCNPLES